MYISDYFLKLPVDTPPKQVTINAVQFATLGQSGRSQWKRTTVYGPYSMVNHLTGSRTIHSNGILANVLTALVFFCHRNPIYGFFIQNIESCFRKLISFKDMHIFWWLLWWLECVLWYTHVSFANSYGL